jgi:cardiolipin synthase
MEKENIFNVPNLLSFYRLAVFPIIMYFVFSGNEKLFSLLLCISLVTDILDGLIARIFMLQTRFGARLDSLADIGTYIIAFCGIFKFRWLEISQSQTFIWAFLATYLFPYIISIIRFGKYPSLHLYSSKIGGYIQGAFFFILFYSGYYPWLYIFAMVWGICSCLEESIILLLLPEMKSNCKGLYWVIRH